MAIVAGNIDFHLSGATGTPATSLGGAIHATEIVDATTHNLFDIVSSAEASAGDTEYRCFYVKNAHGTLTLQSAEIYINTNTPSADTAARIALGTSAVNGTEQTVGDESTEPSGVSWSTADGSGNALSIGDIPAGEHKAIWVERVVDASASAADDDNAEFIVVGDTAA